MHEMSITQNIIAIVNEHAGSAKVRKVTLEIGTLAAVASESLKFCFDVCAEGTAAEGAELEIEEVDALGKCNHCGSQLKVYFGENKCECGSRDIKFISGKELRVKEIEVD